MLIRYAYNSYRISMSYDVYRVKNVQKKIADFEHPTQKGFLVIDSFFRNNPIFVFLAPLPLIFKKLPFLQNSYNLSKLSTSYELQ